MGVLSRAGELIDPSRARERPCMLSHLMPAVSTQPCTMQGLSCLTQHHMQGRLGANLRYHRRCKSSLNTVRTLLTAFVACNVSRLPASHPAHRCRPASGVLLVASGRRRARSARGSRRRWPPSASSQRLRCAVHDSRSIPSLAASSTAHAHEPGVPCETAQQACLYTVLAGPGAQRVMQPQRVIVTWRCCAVADGDIDSDRSGCHG